MLNTEPTTLSAIQAACQSTYVNAQLSSTCDSGNEKNKQLTLLSKRKLASTDKNMLMAL
jgi:hypothetical protein